MATAAAPIVGFSNFFPCCLLSPPSQKGKVRSPFLATKRNFTAAVGRLSWSGLGKRMPNFALFSSNSDQQPEEAEGADLSDEAFLPPDDVDYLWKLAAGSVAGGAAVKYGSILFPDITTPNLAPALLMVSLSVMVVAVILIKESCSTSNEDLF